MSRAAKDPPPDPWLHDAFISYSRRDAAFAARLEKTLENYRPPREVRSSGRRLSVFRDEADFSGTNYDESIARHLRGSAKLVVICSPHARGSSFVTDEIRRFVSFRAADHIVPLLIDGIPNNEATAESEGRKAFPELLCELVKMPVASDYRGCDPARDKINRGRFEFEWYRTVANLLDQEPAVVAQRERKRRAQALRIFLSAGAFIMAVLAIALGVALLSRREAIFQRTQVQSTASQADFDLALMYRRGSRTVDPRTLLHLARALRTKPDASAPRDYLVSLLRDVPWHLPVGEPLRHDGEVITAVFSPDGRRVATASSDHTARLWEADTGRAVGPPLRHGGPVLGAAFRPDSARVVTFSMDGTARIWNATNAESVGAVLRHEGPVLTAAFSPDGQWIVTGGTLDQSARLWDAGTGQPVGAPLRHDGGVPMAIFDAESRRLFTATFAGTAQYWRIPDGQPLEIVLRLPIGGAVEAMSPDGGRILTRDRASEAVRLRETRTGQPIDGSVNREESIVRAAFSDDGRQLATASAGGMVKFWDTTNGEPIGGPLQVGGRIIAINFSRDGQWIATASEDGTARIWEPRTGQPVGEAMHHEARVLQVAFSPDGRRLATASADHTARLWSANSGSQVPLVLRHRHTVVAARFAGPDHQLMTVSSDGVAHAWDLKTGRLAASVRHPLAGFPGEVWEADVSASGDRILMAFEKAARVWEFPSGRWIGKPMVHPDEVQSVTFSPDGTRVVTAASDHLVRIWDVSSGEPLGAPLPQTHPVSWAAFSYDGQWIVTGADDNTAQLWESRTEQVVHGTFRHPHESGWDGPLHVVLSPGGGQLATSCMDGTIQLWDTKSGLPTGDLLRHDQDPLTNQLAAAAAAFSPDGARLATVAGDRSARLWDAGTGHSLSAPLAHDHLVDGVEFSRDGRWLVTASEEAALIWDVAVASDSPLPPWLPDLAEALAGKRFDARGGLALPRRSLAAVRGELLSLSGTDYWSRLGRWFFTRGPQRTLSPMSDLTVGQLTKGRDPGALDQELDSRQ